MRRIQLTRAPVFLALALVAALLAGCGGGDGNQAENATPAAETTETVATHDCAGGCGMTQVPEDQMTEIDGNWYCAACAKKVQDETDHSGHGHG